MLTLGIFTAIIFGIIFDSIPHIKSLIPYVLASLIFFSFLKLDINKKNFFKKELLIVPLFTWVIFPAVILFFTKNLNQDFRIGFFILSITPTAIGCPVVASLIHADKEFIASQVILSNLLSPFSYSILLFLYFNQADISIPILLILKRLVMIIIFPLFLSLVVKKLKKVSDYFSKVGRFYIPFSFLFVIFSAVSASAAKLKSLDFYGIIIVILYVFFCALLFFTTGLFFPGEMKKKKTMALSMGHKNTALSIWIVLSNFSSATVIPLIFYIIFHHIFNGILTFISSKD